MCGVYFSLSLSLSLSLSFPPSLPLSPSACSERTLQLVLQNSFLLEKKERGEERREWGEKNNSRGVGEGGGGGDGVGDVMRRLKEDEIDRHTFSKSSLYSCVFIVNVLVT